MSKFKRITAIVLAFILVFALSACRTKDESALVFGDLSADKGSDGRVDIRSAIYMLYCIQADGEFKNQVSEKQQQASTTSSSTVNYEKEKLDDKDYDTWVKDKAFEYCSEFAYVELEFNKLKLSLSQEELTQRDYYVDMYWTSYGYGPVYEQNGITKPSFTTYWENSFKREALFKYYYGENGKNAVSVSDVKKAIDDNHVLANSLSVKFTTDSGATLTDAEKKEAKAKLDNYAERIKKGEKFAALKAEYEAAQQAQTTTAAGTTVAGATTAKATAAATTAATTAAAQATTVAPTTAAGSAPLDSSASLFYGPKTSNADNYFSEIKKLSVGTVKVIEFSDCYMLVVRQEVLKDPYYIKNLDSSARHILKDTDFDKKLSTGAKELSVDRNDGAIKFYAPKKIVYTTKAA